MGLACTICKKKVRLYYKNVRGSLTLPLAFGDHECHFLRLYWRYSVRWQHAHTMTSIRFVANYDYPPMIFTSLSIVRLHIDRRMGTFLAKNGRFVSLLLFFLFDYINMMYDYIVPLYYYESMQVKEKEIKNK